MEPMEERIRIPSINLNFLEVMESHYRIVKKNKEPLHLEHLPLVGEEVRLGMPATLKDGTSRQIKVIYLTMVKMTIIIVRAHTTKSISHPSLT
jgi:hypothetical protein